MRIGFDAKRLFFNHTGLGVYSRLLLEGMMSHAPEHDYLLYARSPEKSQWFHPFSNYSIHSSKKPFWRSWGIVQDINQDQCDIYHGLSHEIPLNSKKLKCKTVVTIHDTIFKVNPELYSPIDRWIYDRKWKYSCRNADLIVAVSQHTRDDIIEFYQADPERITVIPPPVDFNAEISAAKLQEVQSSFDLPTGFLLFVSSITERKNLAGLLEALHMIPSDERPPLVIVGTGNQESLLKQYVIDHELSKDVYWVGHVDNTELPAFYHLASALVYPSFYEGFGLPIVEALLCKTPVITSKTSSMPEAAGPGALLIDPHDSQMISESIIQLMSSPILQSQLAERGYEHATQFSRDKIAEKMLEAYQGLLT